MDEGFFDCFEATKGTRGEVKATVLIVKSSLLMEVRITIEGMVKATCDRCLGEVNLPVSGVMNLYVKLLKIYYYFQIISDIPLVHISNYQELD